MIHTGGSSFTCGNALGCAVTGVDGATYAFTPKPGTSEPISGAVQVLAGTTPILFADYDSQGDTTTGSGNVVDFQSASYANVQFNNIDRQTTNPMLNPTNAGRRFYATSDGGVTVRFFGFLRADNTINDNGATDRVRFDRRLGVSPPSNADQTAIQAAVSPGDTIFMADADDDGTSTSFGGGSTPAATAATSFSLHGANTGFIAEGDTITTSAAYSTF